MMTASATERMHELLEERWHLTQGRDRGTGTHGKRRWPVFTMLTTYIGHVRGQPLHLSHTHSRPHSRRGSGVLAAAT